MRKYYFIGFLTVVFFVMTIAVVLRSISAEQSARGGWGGRQTPVSVHTIEALEFADVFSAIGTARANESVTITAKVSDVIARIEFESGDEVEQGEILIELADDEEAAGLSEARATMRETSREVERIRDLTERGVAPRSRLDEAVAAMERARARVEAIEARVADRIIRAPFSGVVGLRNVSVGELIGPGDAIVQLDDSSAIKLDFTLPERFLSVVEPGLNISAISSAWPDTIFEGLVANVDSRVDPTTRAITVRAVIDNADRRLRPGMLMSVEMRRAERSRPAIPGNAIIRIDETAFVFVVENTEQEASVVRRDFELGIRQGGMVEVLEGLSVGEQIVGEGVHRLSPGARVQIAAPDTSEHDNQIRHPTPPSTR
jgi:membrane fusion protein (multidrug efflux system)